MAKVDLSRLREEIEKKVIDAVEKARWLSLCDIAEEMLQDAMVDSIKATEWFRTGKSGALVFKALVEMPGYVNKKFFRVIKIAKKEEIIKEAGHYFGLNGVKGLLPLGMMPPLCNKFSTPCQDYGIGWTAFFDTTHSLKSFMESHFLHHFPQILESLSLIWERMIQFSGLAGVFSTSDPLSDRLEKLVLFNQIFPQIDVPPGRTLPPFSKETGNIIAKELAKCTFSDLHAIAEKVWNEKLLMYPASCSHGDLNPQNILFRLQYTGGVPEVEDFSFIDFSNFQPSTQKIPVGFDLAYLEGQIRAYLLPGNHLTSRSLSTWFTMEEICLAAFCKEDSFPSFYMEVFERLPRKWHHWAVLFYYLRERVRPYLLQECINAVPEQDVRQIKREMEETKKSLNDLEKRAEVFSWKEKEKEGYINQIKMFRDLVGCMETVLNQATKHPKDFTNHHRKAYGQLLFLASLKVMRAASRNSDCEQERDICYLSALLQGQWMDTAKGGYFPMFEQKHFRRLKAPSETNPVSVNILLIEFRIFLKQKLYRHFGQYCLAGHPPQRARQIWEETLSSLEKTPEWRTLEEIILRDNWERDFYHYRQSLFDFHCKIIESLREGWIQKAHAGTSSLSKVDRVLFSEITKMGETKKKVSYLFFYAGKTKDEISQRLFRSLGTVDVLIDSAYKALKGALEKAFPDEPWPIEW